MERRTVLVVDAGGHSLEPATQQLRLLGIPALRAKTGGEARAAIGDARAAIGAVMIPPDPPTLDLPRALHALSTTPDGVRRVLLACGPRPDPTTRSRLREAGVRLALWEPFDDAVLRFQVNRALAGDGAAAVVPRASARVPASWPVEVRLGARTRPARLYSLSARGAFLEIAGPALRRALVHITLPLPAADLRVAGEVVSTNVPGNLRRRNLPIGMGIRFLGLSTDVERALRDYTTERADQLIV